jgi:hypothetical protein
MPNIEIHSLAEGPAQNLLAKIFDLFTDKPHSNEIVVSICSTRTFDSLRKMQPFIRLVNSCQDHTDEMITMLRTLGYDIEHLSLAAFYPATKQEAE